MKDDILRSMRVVIAAVFVSSALAACGPPPRHGVPAPTVADVLAPAEKFSGEGLTLGEPLAVAVDFEGRVVIADGSPGRLVRWNRGVGEGGEQEFQRPASSVGFYPTDAAIRGFFAYAVDESGRRVLRFDDDGAYRDVLLSFEGLSLGRRVSPYSVAVDQSGRVAISDVENHQILIFDAYLTLEIAFGNFGAYEGQLSSPQGVSFSPRGELVVADTGNRRVQVFSDGGAFLRSVPSPGLPNPLRRPRRAVIDAAGRTIVADPAAGAVFVFDTDGSLERAVAPGRAFAPTDVELSRGGLLFVTDEASRSVLVFKGI
jgi:hypothetical protein